MPRENAHAGVHRAQLRVLEAGSAEIQLPARKLMKPLRLSGAHRSVREYHVPNALEDCLWLMPRSFATVQLRRCRANICKKTRQVVPKAESIASGIPVDSTFPHVQCKKASTPWTLLGPLTSVASCSATWSYKLGLLSSYRWVVYRILFKTVVSKP